MKNQDTQDVAQDLCEWFVCQENVQNLAIDALAKTCCRTDTWDIMMWQLSAGFFGSSFAPETQKFLTDMTEGLVNSPVVQDKVTNEIINTMSLGTYNLINSKTQDVKSTI